MQNAILAALAALVLPLLVLTIAVFLPAYKRNAMRRPARQPSRPTLSQ
jgi:hypothetical protein